MLIFKCRYVDIEEIVWQLYPEHNFPNMLLFQEQGLGITDFFQSKQLGHNRFYNTLLNVLNQSLSASINAFQCFNFCSLDAPRFRKIKSYLRG